jgi:hypothetical protein
MADFEKVEFEFPDEVEDKQSRKGGKVVAAEEDKPEIEVVDDTPEDDRNITPMAEPPADVTDDELEKYTDKRLKDRLAKLGKGYHDERRAKEAAFREKEEALRLAQAVVEENKKLKGSLNTNQEVLLEQAKRVVLSEVEAAERSYRAAYESGDPDAMIKAQKDLTAATIRADKVNNFKHTPLQDGKNVVQTTQLTQAPKVDPKAERWFQSNPWYGKDREMTGYALTLHEKMVIEDGIDPNSDEYYTRLNSRLRQVFPEKFAAVESADAPESQRQKANVVAPATRSTAPKKIVLNATQVQLAKKLGVPLELYARKVAEEMRK